MKPLLTEEEILKIIKSSQYGEYDQYHDWNPSYNHAEKINLFAQLLEKAESISSTGKEILELHFRQLEKESGRDDTGIEELFVMLEKIGISE